MAPRTAADGESHVGLEAGDILSTDTFFGSFYRAYWQAFTAVKDIAVVVGFRGRGKVRVFEDIGRGVVLLCEYDLQTPGLHRHLIRFRPTSLDTTLFGGEPTSRLFVEVEAKRSSEVHSIDFVTEEAPQRQATLSIGLCTFNQEAYFARTLGLVARLAAGSDAIRAVHVINQGAPFQSPAILGLLEAPKIHAIAQRNLGGCGGFTRSLAEELAAPAPASHHLMMDDDIVLDERMILRALRFLDYADRDIALGAGMLDSLRPTVMYEGGAFLRNDNTIHPYCHNVDLADTAQLWHFNTPVRTDYNAWWFCILPVEQARKLALPAPVFIRGDDFEYGQRLARAGVPTVTLPGIGVWHEPFYAKPSGWQDYYDLRNRLIFGATYGDKVQQLSLAHVTGLITTAILTHNYMSAELRMRAVTDFLTGPDRLFGSDPEEIHKGIMALARQHAPERLDASWKQRPLSQGKPRPTSMRGLAIAQLVSMLRTGLGPLRRGTAMLLDADAHPGNTAGRGYVLTNGPRSYHLRFVPRRGRMWSMMLRAALLTLRYRSGRTAAGEAWAAGIATYRDPAWWAGTFGPAAAPAQPGTAAPALSPALPAVPGGAPTPAAKPQEQLEKI
ncbi:glycosyltransferase [Paracoccaceae bacterium Fryx2]|nr:glycosyltransferase [Paracoccaceae bacterium Fryx2]